MNGQIRPPHGRITPAPRLLTMANHVGKIQNGNVSGLLLRKYVADLSEYSKSEVVICLGNSIVANLLLARDLILLFLSVSGYQKQLNSLFRFL